ncbi:MAG: ABC transporter substrate-binding protein [Acidobacteriota bacterium]
MMAAPTRSRHDPACRLRDRPVALSYTTRFVIVVLALCAGFGAGCTDRRAGLPLDDSGPPTRGGTLEIVGRSDLDHLATTSAYTTKSLWLIQTFARQLLAYRSVGEYETKIQPIADLAVEVPTRANGGVSADGLTYVFHLRRGVRWDTTPPREVTANDIVRAFKLFCNPVSPVGASVYYTSTILGMAAYCEAFSRAPGTVEGIRAFVITRDLEGVRATDDFTVVFRLCAPASDFLNLLALNFASPVPVEYLDVLPDSPEFRQHTISNGPYRITRYVQNRELFLDRNPAWVSGTDPVRTANVDRIRVRFGVDDALQQLQIEAGTADLSLDTIPPAELASLLAMDDPTVLLTPAGDVYTDLVLLCFNRMSQMGRGPLSQPQVRRAVALAVDKAAIAQLLGGPRVTRPARQAVLSGAGGFRPGADRDVTPGDRGDPQAARRLLAEVGYPKGLSLRLGFTSASRLQAQALQASLSKAGISVQIAQYTFADYMGRLLADPDNARRGEWDLALVDWGPDWFGNNSRSVLVPLFDSRNVGQNGANYGGYRNAEVDALMHRATTVVGAERVEQAWFDVAQRLMDDVAFVPLTESRMAYARSRRVRGCAWSVIGLNCSLPALWLADAAPPKRIMAAAEPGSSRFGARREDLKNGPNMLRYWP